MYQQVSDLVVEGVLPLLAPERSPGHHGLRRRHPGGDELGHAAGAVRRRQRQQVRHVGTAAKVAALLNTPKLQTVFVVQKPFNTLWFLSASSLPTKSRASGSPGNSSKQCSTSSIWTPELRYPSLVVATTLLIWETKEKIHCNNASSWMGGLAIPGTLNDPTSFLRAVL